MTLNACPTDFFAEVEQVAYCTQNIVPGIDFSDDPLLQGRNFSYLDTQLLRLGGPNFNGISFCLLPQSLIRYQIYPSTVLCVLCSITNVTDICDTKFKAVKSITTPTAQENPIQQQLQRGHL